MARRSSGFLSGIGALTILYFIGKALPSGHEVDKAATPNVPVVEAPVVQTAQVPDPAITTDVQTHAPVPKADGVPWKGPKWKGKRRNTALDKVFPPTEEGRQDFINELSALEKISFLAFACEIRPEKWSTLLSHHVTEVLEDGSTRLGDPRPFPDILKDRTTQVEADANKEAELYTDKHASAAQDIFQEDCDDARKSTDLTDGDEIVRRRLFRAHGDWEGAGEH